MNSANFLFDAGGRVRSGWRVLIFQFLFVVCGEALGAAISFALARSAIAFERGSVLWFVVNNSLLLVPSLAVGWLCGRLLEGLPLRALGVAPTKGWWKDLFFGLIVGAASISFAVLLAALFGGMRLAANDAAGKTAIGLTLAVSLLVFIIGAAAEEAYFRGYILQTFARARLVWVGVAFNVVFFAGAHLQNPGASRLSTLNTVLASVWFVVAYLKTRRLWFPVGIHLAWNWVQGAIFGIPVSGITSLMTAPFLIETDKGAALITGGDYGVEGGVACTIALIVSGIFIWLAPIFKTTEEMPRLTSKKNGTRLSASRFSFKSPES